MTHEYTVLIGGIIIPGGDQADVSAIAWADDTILALGGDGDVLAISRGNSHVHDLRGAVVVPLAAGSDTAWSAAARLEVGGRADLAVLLHDPRVEAPHGLGEALALVRGGHVVAGALPHELAAGEHQHAIQGGAEPRVPD